MKLTSSIFPGRAPLSTKGAFGNILKQQSPALPKKLSAPAPAPVASGLKPLPSVAPKQAPIVANKSARQVIATHEKTSTALTTARASSHHSAAQLQDARVAHHHVANDRLDTRLVDLICKELVSEFTSEPSKSRVANQDLPLPPPTPNAVTASVNVEPPKFSDGAVNKAAQAVELIEKIETFIKDSRRPCIALTLNNSLGAKVEIERVGPREVALKVVGHKGPPKAEDISRIRDEMRARGLKVCALSVA